MNELPLFERAKSHGDAPALVDGSRQLTYRDLLERSAAAAGALLDGRDDLCEERIAFLLPAGIDYVSVQWGIWRAGGVAVPLSLSATEHELSQTIEDSQASCIVSAGEYAQRIAGIGEQENLRRLDAHEFPACENPALPKIDPSRRAMIVYTSGTTSRPKGVVSTHAGIAAQIESLVEAWEWEPQDRIPLFLPLHHVHGIVNVLCCALWSGAVVETFPRFDSEQVLKRVAAGAYTVFMAVPTIYVKLIEAIEAMMAAEREPVIAGFGKMRLMVSGSAALPVSVHERWTELTGQRLLERYGMTEIGMALSNPYGGERRAGAVGQPLPGVELRLVSESGSVISAENEPGEIQVRGPCVFQEYWNRPEATREAFRDGWFRTGDLAVLEDGYYRIMGRQSVDIIKSGGYKLSALEIEAALLDHPAIREAAVVGLPDETWGEIVAVAVVLEAGEAMREDDLKTWCRDRLSEYKIPRRVACVDQLPRNAMGKITKPKVRELFC